MCTYTSVEPTSQIPLTRYPKKNPEEQRRNCCHLGFSVKDIPNRYLVGTSSPFFISRRPPSPSSSSRRRFRKEEGVKFGAVHGEINVEEKVRPFQSGTEKQCYVGV